MTQWLEISPAWTGAVGFVSVLVASYVWQRVTYRGPFVKGLYIYPIKSCKGIKVSSAYVTKRGFKYDRSYMIVTAADGNFVTQRKCSKMVLITPVILETEGIMVITAPGMPELRVPLGSPDGAKVMEVKVWNDRCQAEVIDVNGASEWFTTYMGIGEVHLVRMVDDFVRPADPKYAAGGQTAFPDDLPFLLISDESIRDLNNHLEHKITMERLRPNIVVGNVGAFAEDSWRKISIQCSGDTSHLLTMDVVKPCARCTIPNIDPRTAVSNPEPTIAMKTYRTGAALGFDNPKWKREVFFGQFTYHGSQEGMTVHVGADLQVLA